MSQNDTNAFGELIDAFKYLFQSAKGKYSINSYLEVLSEFTDGEINAALDNGEVYGGGEVTFLSIMNSDTLKVSIEMRFYDDSVKKTKTRKAERKLERKMFTSEALSLFDKNGETTFEIKPPRRV